MSKQYRIASDLKEQVLNRIKNDGISVSQAASDHGISNRTIYGWLKQGTESGPTLNEVKLNKEVKELHTLIGELTVRLSQAQKKN